MYVWMPKIVLEVFFCIKTALSLAVEYIKNILLKKGIQREQSHKHMLARQCEYENGTIFGTKIK